MCEHLKDENGQVIGIICGVRAQKKFCACGRVAELLCDWKVGDKKSGTCDKPICRQHALEVGPDKHLCPEHQKAYEAWKRRHPEGMPTEPKQAALFSEVT